ncbi:unnamed protein product [Caenorhabditis angaria]|uniref:Chondroitin proteoglycan 4 domain-containing protein n=1 Tax=Caenorhabditis angaria TaxID=860376 RepID=A0A9P1IQ57_9PELO|nr:unnamed protein product [Caenorhabditis angaria]
MFNFSLIFAVFGFSAVFSAETAPDEISPCLKKCLTPMAKLERSFSYIFNNFEKACDLLEDTAFCARKCEKEDQTKFYQYTTFYRIHCIDYQEDLEEHIPCIAAAAKEADDVCRDKCKHAHKVMKNAEKEEKMKSECRTLECSTICYFDELTESCPEAKDILLKINLGQIHSISNSIHPANMDKMIKECRQIHDIEYMRAKLLASTQSLMLDHSGVQEEQENPEN